MIRGISREKPAEVLVRWIERIWSAYEVRGDRIRLEIKCQLDGMATVSTVKIGGEGRESGHLYKIGAKAEIRVARTAIMAERG